MSISGVPDRGFGLSNVFTNNGSASFYSNFDWKIAASGCYPTSMTTFGPGFGEVGSSASDWVAGWQAEFKRWAAEPRLNGSAFTDTLGNFWPKRPRPMLPCISAPGWLIDLSVTFQDTYNGRNDAYWTGLVDAAMSQGFPEVDVRINWEDEYAGTTPANVEASVGHNAPFPAGTNSKGQAWQTAWGFYGGGSGNRTTFAKWLPDYQRAWRYAKNRMNTYAQSKYGGKVNGVWGPVFITYFSLGASGIIQMDPDGYSADGLGHQVDAFAPDLYFGPIYDGLTTLFTGYQNQPPFTTNFASTGKAGDGVSGSSSSIQARLLDLGSMYRWADFMDYNNTNPNPTVGSGFSFWHIINYMKNRPNGAPVVPICHPEYGILSQSGNVWADPADSGKYYWSGLGPYTRSRIAYLQSIGIPVRYFNVYSGSGKTQYKAFGTTWPELKGNGGFTIGDTNPTPPPPPVTTPSATINALPSPLYIGSVAISGTYNAAVTSVQALWSDTQPTSLAGFATMGLSGGTWSGSISVSVSGTPGSVWLALNGVLPTVASATATPQTPVQVVDAISINAIPNGNPGGNFSIQATSNYALPAVSNLRISIVPTGTAASFGGMPSGTTIASNQNGITIPEVYGSAQTYDVQIQDTANNVTSAIAHFTVTPAVVGTTQSFTVQNFTPLLGSPYNVQVVAAVPVASVSDLSYIAQSGSPPFSFTPCNSSNCTISSDGLTITIVGIVNNNTLSHTFQIKQASTGISSTPVVYTPGQGEVVPNPPPPPTPPGSPPPPPPPPPPPTTELITITYSDGTAPVTVTKAAGVTATVSYQPLANQVVLQSSDGNINMTFTVAADITFSLTSSPAAQTDSIAWSDGSAAVISTGHEVGSTATVTLSGDINPGQ